MAGPSEETSEMINKIRNIIITDNDALKKNQKIKLMSKTIMHSEQMTRNQNGNTVRGSMPTSHDILNSLSVPEVKEAQPG